MYAPWLAGAEIALLGDLYLWHFDDAATSS